MSNYYERVSYLNEMLKTLTSIHQFGEKIKEAEEKIRSNEKDKIIHPFFYRHRKEDYEKVIAICRERIADDKKELNDLKAKFQDIMTDKPPAKEEDRAISFFKILRDALDEQIKDRVVTIDVNPYNCYGRRPHPQDFDHEDHEAGVFLDRLQKYDKWETDKANNNQ